MSIADNIAAAISGYTPESGSDNSSSNASSNDAPVIRRVDTETLDATSKSGLVLA